MISVASYGKSAHALDPSCKAWLDTVHFHECATSVTDVDSTLPTPP